MSGLAALMEDLQGGSLNKGALGTGRRPSGPHHQLAGGMETVDQRFKTEVLFHTNMIMAANMFAAVMEYIKPYPEYWGSGPWAKVDIGTTKGDFYDTGKNIVATMLACHGFEIIDLGVEVAPERFRQAVKDSGAAGKDAMNAMLLVQRFTGEVG